MSAFFSFSLSFFYFFFYDCSYNFQICYYWYSNCYCHVNHYLKLLFQSTFHMRNWLDWAFVDFIITDLKKSKPYLLSGFAIGFDHIDCFLKHTCYVRLSTETGKVGKSQIENFFLEKYFAKMSFLPIIFFQFFYGFRFSPFHFLLKFFQALLLRLTLLYIWSYAAKSCNHKQR